MANTIPLDDTTLAHDHRLRGSLFLAGLGQAHLRSENQAQLGLVLTDPLRRATQQYCSGAVVPWAFQRQDASLSWIGPSVNFIERPCSCKKLSVAENFLLVFQEILIEATLAVRVCAIYGFSRRVFAALAVAAAITVSLEAWAAVAPDSALTVQVPGCYVTTPRPQVIREAIRFSWDEDTRTDTLLHRLICYILILGLTLRRAYTYHPVCAALTLARLVSPNSPRTQIVTAGSLAWVTSAISVTMLSRLMLNSHTAGNRDWTTSTYTGAQETEMRHSNAISDDPWEINGE
ncbi:hypothetical protein K438DRAFT_1981957 [Mycena galopus ATCC 62051]|nr:hypothetical protein K438DRAFT_1981957 [Mycena galopus ATCC 62051]